MKLQAKLTENSSANPPRVEIHFLPHPGWQVKVGRALFAGARLQLRRDTGRLKRYNPLHGNAELTHKLVPVELLADAAQQRTRRRLEFGRVRLCINPPHH